MPTLQLPRDTRWGDLGTGLGTLLGAVVESYQKRKVSEGVGQIWQDPSVPDDQKLTRALQQYGDQGYAVASELYKSKLVAAQLADVQEQAKERRAHGLLEGAQLDKLLLEMPGVTEAQRAAIREKQASAARQEAEVPKIQAEVPKIQAEVPKIQEETSAAAARTRKEDIETKLKQLEYDQQTAAGDPTVFDVETAFKQLIPGATPDQIATAKLEYGRGKTHREGVGKLADYATKLQTQQKPAPLSEGEEKRVEGWAGALSNMKSSLDAFRRNPSGIGLLEGAPFNVWLERHGISTGNPQQVEIWTSAARTVFDAARAGSVFVSGTLIKAAQDITPGVTETPLHYVQVVNQGARENLARLETERGVLSKQKQTPGVVDVYDRLAKGWQEVEEGSRIDYWATYQHDSNKLSGRSAVVYQGDAVDPKTFKVLIDGSKQYPTKVGGTKSGAAIIARAKELQEDPVAIAREIGALK